MKTVLWILGIFLLYTLNGMSCDPNQETFIRPSYCHGSVLKESYQAVSVRSAFECSALCVQNILCLSFSYQMTNRSCHLGYETIVPSCENSRVALDSIYYQKNKDPKVCLNGGSLVGDDCNCTGGYIGEVCERLMQDCSEGYRNGYKGRPAGAYMIFPPGAPGPFSVHCRMTWNGRTYVLMHYNTSISLHLNWDDYAKGFDFDGCNDWIGLRKLHWLTSTRSMTLIIELFEYPSTFHAIPYYGFSIGNESSQFKLLGASMNERTTNEANLTDCMGPLVGSAFSTKDRDNDGNDGRNCSQDYRSGWWFNSQCAQCNPTGEIQTNTGQLRSGVDSEFYWNDYPFNLRAINAWLVGQ